MQIICAALPWWYWMTQWECLPSNRILLELYKVQTHNSRWCCGFLCKIIIKTTNTTKKAIYNHTAMLIFQSWMLQEERAASTRRVAGEEQSLIFNGSRFLGLLTHLSTMGGFTPLLCIWIHAPMSYMSGQWHMQFRVFGHYVKTFLAVLHAALLGF